MVTIGLAIPAVDNVTPAVSTRLALMVTEPTVVICAVIGFVKVSGEFAVGVPCLRRPERFFLPRQPVQRRGPVNFGRRGRKSHRCIAARPEPPLTNVPVSVRLGRLQGNVMECKRITRRRCQLNHPAQWNRHGDHDII